MPNSLLETNGVMTKNPLEAGSLQYGTVTVPQTKPVSVLSSASGQDIVNKNTQKLNGIETSLIPSSQPNSPYSFKDLGGGMVDIYEKGKSISQGGQGYSQDYAKTLGYTPQGPITVGGNPVTTKMAGEINAAVAGGNLTADEKAKLQGIQTNQDEIVTAAAQARAALESGDYVGMDFYTRRAEEQQKALTASLSEYYKQIAPLRERAMSALSPTQKETELGQQLLDIRNQAEQFNIQTEEDKFNEYQGQTLGFAGGRAAEIDIRAEFKRQRFASQEKNLLLSLGLEQEARKMEGEAVEQQMSYIADDFELQQKVQDKITEQEDKLFERADTLRKEQKDTLVTLLDGLAGVNPEKMSPETLKQLETMSARAGLPFDLVQEALKTQHAKQVFDQTLEMAKASKGGADELLSVTEAQALGVPYGTTKGGAVGKIPQGKPTDSNLAANLYATRMKSAEQIIQDLGDSITSIPSTQYAIYKRMEATDIFNPNVPSEVRQARQAERNFINAVLRRESGAVIAESEFENAEKQYFPRPGDDDVTLQQKAAARADALKGLIQAAGPAYEVGNETQAGQAVTREEAQKKLQEFLVQNPERATEINSLKDTIVPSTGKPMDYQEILEYLGISFNSVGGDTKTASNNQGIIAGYDITSYATDPTHEKKVATLFSKINMLKTPQEMAAYIAKVAPKSPVKVEYIMQAANATGTPPALIMAIMQQDSSFGTAGKAVRTMNPGNVGNTDSGAEKSFKSWAEGVMAVAKNLAWRKIA